MEPFTISYRTMRFGQADDVLRLVTSSFDSLVRADCTEEGAEEFFRAAGEMIIDRPDNHFIMVAESDTAVAGMIDVRDRFHISLLFVDPNWMGRGVARGLLNEAIRRIQTEDPDIQELEVNASPWAVPVYEKLGFTRTKPEQEINGIRFVEMKRRL